MIESEKEMGSETDVWSESKGKEALPLYKRQMYLWSARLSGSDGKANERGALSCRGFTSSRGGGRKIEIGYRS